MHQHHRRIGRGEDTKRFTVIGQRRDIIHNAGTRIDGSPHHRASPRINGYGYSLGHCRFYHRNHTGNFIRHRYRRRARPGGFATDIYDRRPVGRQLQGLVDRPSRIEKISTIGETVRRHIHHAHDNGARQVYPRKWRADGRKACHRVRLFHRWCIVKVYIGRVRVQRLYCGERDRTTCEGERRACGNAMGSCISRQQPHRIEHLRARFSAENLGQRRGRG